MRYELGPSDVSIQGDVEAGMLYIPQAKALLRSLLAYMQPGKLGYGTKHERLSDTAYVYAIAANGIAKAVIVVDTPQPEFQQIPRTPPPAVPDFYSGAIFDGGVQAGLPNASPPIPDRLRNFEPTPACLAEFRHLDPGPTAKLAVLPFVDFEDVLGAPPNFPEKFTQYVKLKPSMYSGIMRAVVQHLMGFGRQIGPSIYDAAKPRMKAASATVSTYQRDVQRNGLQIRYDWRWNRTHGVLRAPDGRLWLVEIGSTRGVVAMPLPLNEVTTRPAFLDKVKNKMHDQPAVDALEAFGGFPTGESLPSAAIDSWVRAGLVLQMATTDDLQPFYANEMYYSACGWAFSDDGREAHNTAHTEQGTWRVGVHYAIFLDIGASIPLAPPAHGALALKAKLVGLSTQAAYKDRFGAVMFKIDRLERRDIDTYLHEGLSAPDTFEEIDALTMTPIASASARLQLAERGFLYYLARHQWKMKFPSPELGYLVSFDMNPVIGFVGPPEICNTTMFVFYRGRELKYVRFFHDHLHTAPDRIESDFETCMFIGAWTETVESGRAIPAMMYSNDFDDREEVGASLAVTHITGGSLGVCQQVCTDDPVFPPHATCKQRVRFSKSTEFTGESARSLDGVVVVPFFERCGYYYAAIHSAGGHTHSIVNGFQELDSPWTCNTWRNFPGYTGHYVGDIGHGHWVRLDQHPDGCGPVTDRYGMSPSPIYTASVCADSADTGAWCFVCTDVDAITFFIRQPTADPGESDFTNNVTTVVKYYVFDGEIGSFALPSSVNDNLWTVPSPDPETGDTQYMEATADALGSGTLVQFYRAPDGPLDHRGGPEFAGIDQHSATLIGVIP